MSTARPPQETSDKAVSANLLRPDAAASNKFQQIAATAVAAAQTGETNSGTRYELTNFRQGTNLSLKTLREQTTEPGAGVGDAGEHRVRPRFKRDNRPDRLEHHREGRKEG